jgi:hypothetical protein
VLYEDNRKAGMKNVSDPSIHRQREQQFMQYVEQLLRNDRLRIDTTRGRKPVTTLIRDVNHTDGGVELKRLMSQMNLPDRDLQNRMPTGQVIDVALSQKYLFIFRKQVARLRVVCVSPNKELLASETPEPLDRSDVAEILRQTPPPLSDVPSTIVVLSTSGFTIEAHEAAERRADRTVILVEPNDGGGWNAFGPPESKGLADLFDPEADAQKRQRVRREIEACRIDLTGAGLASDRLAAKTQLDTALVESELKQYAKENPGLAARRLDGRMVLYRQSAAPVSAGGGDMPLIDKMKALFARKGETEKKIEFLSERRAALSQQRDRGYEEIGDLETREAELRKQFADASGDLTKRRVTSQLLQLRKDIERRQQLLSVLNQQVNVVSTHLHNLDLVQQGKTAQLPDSEEMASDAAAAEEMIAELQASGEMAETASAGVQGGMSAEEQALYEELSKAAQPAEEKAPPAPPETAKPIAARTQAPAQPERRATPEAG